MPDVIVRTKFRLFHLVSIVVLKILAFSIEIVSKFVLSNILFKGMFPKKVTPKTPIQYMIKDAINNQNRLLGYVL